MGQQDPLVAWQREGFQMFGQMMDAIDDDYLRYVMHVQVITEPAPELDLTQASYQAPADPSQASLIESVRAAAEEAAAGMPPGADGGSAALAATAAARPAPVGGQRLSGGNTAQSRSGTSSARSAGGASKAGAGGAGSGSSGGSTGGSGGVRNAGNGRGTAGRGQGEKLGRNAPCWCGSGKKYKLCHGAS
jgi:preprotein translocase subunit SecA